MDFILDNIRMYPELTDEFCIFILNNYIDDQSIGNRLYDATLKNPSPYEYVEGKHWELLSYFPCTKKNKLRFLNYAIKRLKKARSSHALRRGLLIYLC